MGQDTFQCCECGGEFDVDWGEGVASHLLLGNRDVC